ncbi:MAG: glycosyltransferase, partial [Thermoguttaceae bacterium]|nr:glycosyltransferase [Thermoguttaceae bacterium]
HTWLFAANAYGRRAAFSLGVPAVVCGERCLDPWKARWQGWVDRRLEPKTDAFAVNSSGIVDFYVERGIPAEKFVVIPNAVEPPAPVSADADERAAAKIALLKELKLPYEPGRLPFLIGLVARLWPQKRVKEALWAADQLKFAQLDFYLLVIGDGPERESLLRYRDALRATDRVRFLGERSDVSRLLPTFDLLWNCSAYEGQSNSILEAQSVGVPVIASDVPGNRDLVVPGETGVLVPEFDGDRIRRRTALTRETFRLLKDENAEKRRALAAAARARVEREFSLGALIARHVELYERLVAEKKRR